MTGARLDFLFVTLFPASPPTFGAQRRIDGLMRALGKRHRVSCVSLLGMEYDGAAAEAALRKHCDEVVLVPWGMSKGLPKRIEQLRSMASRSSFERRAMNTRALQTALRRVLGARAYDVVSVEAPVLAFSDLHIAPRGATRPRVVVDAHNVEHDLARQSGEASSGLLRRAYHAVNWRKLMREEIAAWRTVDGTAFTSADDLRRAREFFPGIRGTVVANAVDVDQFRPRPDLPRSDGRTIVFFGTLDYFPNQDGVRWFLSDIWPLLERRRPDVRLKLIGPHPTPDVLARRGPRIEVAGLVDDLPRHLSEAAAIIVPLRVGGGTRFKILEAMAMARPVVSTTLGAEGIDARPGHDILLADEPEAFVAAVERLLDDPALAASLGAAGRAIVERRYSWAAAAGEMERFAFELLGRDGGMSHEGEPMRTSGT